MVFTSAVALPWIEESEVWGTNVAAVSVPSDMLTRLATSALEPTVCTSASETASERAANRVRAVERILQHSAGILGAGQVDDAHVETDASAARRR